MTGSYLEELFGLEGRVAVVIGGTGVLCGAMAHGLARAGARVVIAGRDEERGAARVAEIEELGGGAIFAPVDVLSRPSLEALLRVCLEREGRVDMLVNGAGINRAGAYLEIDDEEWERVIAANLGGVHLGCQVFGRHMVAAGGGGAILNVASVSAARPLARVVAYSASKAAVVNLTRSLARELAPHGVRVNALCPGFFPAEQNRRILDRERSAMILSQTPLARFGEPDELVGATLLLLGSRAGSFITGACCYVDGGFTCARL